MVDLVVGLGEIGLPIRKLLEERGFMVEGCDPPKMIYATLNTYDMIHICFPYNGSFVGNVEYWKNHSDKIVVHSTVKPKTCKQLEVIYSPVRGVHTRMLEDLKYYTKYYSGEIDKEFEKRFVKCKNVPSSTKLEQTKLIVDTTYYGWLIAFRKYVDNKYDVDWSFAEEIHEKLGNRPTMYNDNKPIGGHCVIPNLAILGDELFRDVIK